jgi:adenosylcobinamide-phosphate synthase
VTLPVLAVGVAAALDALIGEPPGSVHPVAWFGRLVAPLDRAWDRPRLVGAVAAFALPLGAAIIVGALVALATLARPLAGALAAGVVLALSSSLRRLLAVAREVTAASDADLPAARERLLALAGRDADDLSAGRVRSAVVESLAENLADGLVAPQIGRAHV